MHRTWLEISKVNLLHNIGEFLNLIGPHVHLMAVVKANAYGHGITQVAELLGKSEQGINPSFTSPYDKGRQGGVNTIWFGVDSIDEALTLRAAGIAQPILALGYVPLDRLHEAVEQGIRLTVYNRETIEALGKITPHLNPLPQGERKQKKLSLSLHGRGQGEGVPIKLHLKLETGTNRQGVLPEQALELCKLIQQYPHLELEGISSHFANIEDTTDHTFAMLQLQRFNQFLNLLTYNLQPTNYKLLIRHMACTAATILFPQTYFNMVRVGIGLYGLWPSRETLVAAKKSPLHPPFAKGEAGGFNLQPVLSWKTRIAQIKQVKAGESVGYGLSERMAQDSKIAILPIGYYDGYDRKLSSLGNVLIGGTRCKIIGRINMNMCMVDITHMPSAKVEDEVVLVGEQGTERITAEELAQKVGTINYEVVARINPMLPRMVI